MWYAIICEDVADSLPLRQQVRPQHLAALQQLRDQGRLLTAGPLPAIDSEDPGSHGFSGSLIIADFPSLAAATAWAHDDAYRRHGVFKQISVKPYRQTF